MAEVERDEILELLTAFADGELDPTGSLQALAYLQEHATAVRWMHDQQRITVAARAGLDSTAHASDTLRQQVTAMGKAAPLSLDAPPRVHWLRILGSSLTVAASLLIVIGAFVQLRSQPATGTGNSSSIIPASIVAHASQIHADCSRLANGLHAASFVDRDGPLAADVREDLNGINPYPDLSSIGFRYEGAGPCEKPLVGTVHLLYRSMKPDGRRSISLFVQRFSAQFTLEPNRVYTASVAQSPFPMLLWRTDHVVYFLIADTNETEDAALRLIQKPMKQRDR